MQNRQKQVRRDTERTKKLVQIGMLAAVAAVLMVFEFPLPFLAPSFYEMDFSEVPILIGSFAMGPMAGAVIEFVKILLNLVINGTDTMFVGEAANFVMGCTLVVPAGIIYKRHKTRKWAVCALIAGSVSMTVSATLVNAFVMIPTYAKVFHMPVERIVEAGGVIHPAIDSLVDFSVLAVAPFNLIKAICVSIITFLLYKRISRLLK